MRINNTLQAINAHRQLGNVQTSQAKSMEKLTSGDTIKRAGDVASGLAISEKMRGQIKGLNQASRNAQDGISLIQTAEGALNESHSILQRMRELAVQGSNDTYASADRAQIGKEVAALQSELDRISSDTEFNKISVLNSTSSVSLQIGANAGQSMSVSLNNASASSLGVSTTAISFSSSTTAAQASAMITTIDSAIEKVSGWRADFGAAQNRLEHTISNLDTGAENLQASESRIRDVDMAKEMMSFTKNNILSQAAQSMLAQANQAPQGVLQLLG